MRIGISISSSLTADRPAQMGRWMVERAAAAYEAGLCSLSVGDHHATPSWYAQNTPILGRLLAEWPDRPAGCLFLVPLWHPVLVAEHVGTLAAIVDAPFIVQTGIGTGQYQFASMGADLSTRGRDTDESIELIQALLAGREVSSDRLNMGPSTVALRPTQDVEWWIGGHAPAAIERAARVGTAWYGGPNLTAEESASHIDHYRRACEANGGPPRSIARRDVLVLADGDRARRRAQPLIDQGYRGIDPAELLIGSAEEVAIQIQGLANLGYDDVIVRAMTPDQDDALESIGQLGLVQAGL